MGVHVSPPRRGRCPPPMTDTDAVCRADFPPPPRGYRHQRLLLVLPQIWEAPVTRVSYGEVYTQNKPSQAFGTWLLKWKEGKVCYLEFLLMNCQNTGGNAWSLQAIGNCRKLLGVKWNFTRNVCAQCLYLCRVGPNSWILGFGVCQDLGLDLSFKKKHFIYAVRINWSRNNWPEEQTTSVLRGSAAAWSSCNNPNSLKKRAKCELYSVCRQQVVNSLSSGGLRFKE